MNKQKALEILKNMLSEFDVHPKFIRELADLLKGTLSGKESQFFDQLGWQLANIIKFGVRVNEVGGNEQLKGADGRYYSIHVHGTQFNIRLIVHISDGEAPVLLCAFSERAGKRRTDYTRYTNIMEERFNELKGGDHDE